MGNKKSLDRLSRAEIRMLSKKLENKIPGLEKEITKILTAPKPEAAIKEIGGKVLKHRYNANKDLDEITYKIRRKEKQREKEYTIHYIDHGRWREFVKYK